MAADIGFLRTEERVNIWLPHVRYGKEAGCKRFMEAVLWMARVVLLCHVQARVIVILRGVDGEELLGVNPE
jgi:hypothetical protein